MSSRSPAGPVAVGEAFRIAEWRVDPAACRIERDGEARHVEPKAMQVLAHLADRPGRVVSRRELEELVWPDAVVGYEAVTNTVIKLRKALDDDARDCRIIETIPKRGYRLVVDVDPVVADTGADPYRAGDGPVSVPTAVFGQRPEWWLTAVIGLVACAAALAWLKPWSPALAPASVDDMAYPLPDKPSIVVLPFDDFSGTADGNAVALGITEDLVTALSELERFFVISRITSFAYRDRSATATEIAEELGVRYILEGGVQRSTDRLRITAQLVDAVKGHHLWAQRFEGGVDDLFALQDDIVRRVLIELQGELWSGDHARIAGRGTTSLEAWLLRVRATDQVYRFDKAGTMRARELLRKAAQADPEWARPLAGLAWTYWFAARKGWTPDRQGAIRAGVELAERCIEMDPDEPLGYMQLGNLRQLQGKHTQALALREKAVNIAPNDFQANWGLGSVLAFAGQPDRAVQVLKRARRLSPRHPAALLWELARAQLIAGRYEAAVETGRRAIARNPDHIAPHIIQAAALAALGRVEQARAEAAQIKRLDHDFTVSSYEQAQTYKDPVILDRVGRLLAKAGVPE